MDFKSLNLDQMSQAELAEIATILDQQEKAYESNKLELYVPHSNGIDGGQEAFHRSNAKIRLVVTGNRYGKTTASVMEAAWLALGIHPYHPIPVPNRGKIYADSYPMVMENIFIKVQEWIPKRYLDKRKPYSYNNQGMLVGLNWHNGSITRIGSYDQTERKAEGSNWNYVAFDEPPTRELYVANLRGCVDFGGLMWFSMTPLSEAWIFDDLWMPGIEGRKKHVQCFRGTSFDNPHVDRESLEIFASELDASERNIRIDGNFVKLQGLVMSTYNPGLSDVDPFIPDDNFVLYEGIDPHPDKPHSVVWKAVHRTGLRYIVDELACHEGIISLAHQMHEKRNLLQSNGCMLVSSVSDTSLNQKDPMSRLNLFNELKSELASLGESVMPVLAHKKDWLFDGITKLKDLYRPVIHTNAAIREIVGDKPMPMQYITRNCTNYKQNMSHYQWPKSALDMAKPIAKHNDYIDCDRYIESKAPVYHTPGNRFIYRNQDAYKRIPPELLRR